VDGFDFKDKRLLDQHIDPHVIIDRMALIDHGYSDVAG
jgi:hypothetical protein